MLIVKKMDKAGTSTYEWDKYQTIRCFASIINHAPATNIRSVVIEQDGKSVTWTDGGSLVYRATGPDDEMGILRTMAEGFAKLMAEGSPALPLAQTDEEADSWDDLNEVPLDFYQDS
jgi:hypothetical protein